MYISFDKLADVSQITCSGSPIKNWAALPLDSIDPKVQALISLALSAQAQNISVQVEMRKHFPALLYRMSMQHSILHIQVLMQYTQLYYQLKCLINWYLLEQSITLRDVKSHTLH